MGDSYLRGVLKVKRSHGGPYLGEREGNVDE